MQPDDLSWFAAQIFGEPFRETWVVTDADEFLHLVRQAADGIAADGRKRSVRAAETLRQWLEVEDPQSYYEQHRQEASLALRRLRHPRHSKALHHLVRLERPEHDEGK